MHEDPELQEELGDFWLVFRVFYFIFSSIIVVIVTKREE